MQCDSCGRTMRPDARFCDGCGKPVATKPAPRVAAGRTGLTRTERRQLTVMFCDLVGSTALAERLDPEDYQEWLEAYRNACSDVINRYGGRIARLVGDGLLIYFGYPVAHEDDAQRAIRSGLGIIDAVRQLSERFGRRYAGTLEVRVGVHTGLVVVGGIGAGDVAEEMGTVGETPNVAARVQAAAAVNQLVISQATHALAQGFFNCESLGRRNFKGVSEPLEIYRVDSETVQQSRLEIAARTGLTPLIGRSRELEMLTERWRQTERRRGTVILLSGDAGIGKSRLLRALKEHISDTKHSTWEGRCLPHFSHSALFPVSDLLQRALRLGDVSPEERMGVLTTALGPYVVSDDDLTLLASIVGAPTVDDECLHGLSPSKRKQMTLEAIAGLFEGMSKESPLLLIIEDLHWIDPSTIELLHVLITRCLALPLMIVLSYRPEFDPPWEQEAHIEHMRLERLSSSETRKMVKGIVKGKDLPRALVDHLIQTTDGIPLFVEEVTKMELESGSLIEIEDGYELKSPLLSRNIPATLRDSLAARIDRLNGGKVVAQLASTVGREFSYDLLAAIAPLEEDDLRRALDQLVDSDLLLRPETQSDTVYVFKHALIQEAAYESMLKRTRREYHSRIADILADPARDVATNHPELLAHHYTEAGFAEQGIRYWKMAGIRAAEYSANVEAERHLRRALELVDSIDSDKRPEEELDLLVALGVPLTANKGYAHAETESLYLRCQELSEQLRDDNQLFRAHSGLYRCYVTRSDLHRSLHHADRLLAVSQEKADSDYMVEAERAVGATLLGLGRLEEALEHLEHGVAIYEPDKHFHHTFETATDPGLSCLNWMLSPLWILGWPDKTIAKGDEALKLARTRNNAYEMAYTLVFSAWTLTRLRDWALARQRAEEGIRLAEEHGFPLWNGAGRVFLGRSLVELGHAERGLELLERGLAFYRRTGAGLTVPQMLSQLAESCTKTGDYEQALASLEEAIETTERNDERTWESEIYRLRGEAMRFLGKPVDDVLRQYRKAQEIARSQKAKSLELRAAMSLARLSKECDGSGQARAELIEVYEWFDEGFQTPDLKDARALIATLS